MMDFMKMLGNMKDIQAKAKGLREQIAHVQASGETGAGVVQVTVNGLKQVLSITIDPDMINPSERTILQDLIVGAVNNAMQAVSDKVKEEVKKSTGELLPNLPIDLDFMV